MAHGVEMPMCLLFTTLLVLLLHVCAGEEDRFTEELYVKPLQSGHVYTHFQFTTLASGSSTGQHYRLFPRSLGEVLTKYSVQELHLSLTQGRWRHEQWGYPLYDAPPGAEIWVWFQEGTRNVDQTWTELINVLSGMFCASLNFMDSTATVAPRFSFRPEGVSTERSTQRPEKLLRYSALPRENVCTENLTPWKKLLPCSSRAGLGTLFNAARLYDSTYHSLALHYKPLCHPSTDNCTAQDMELSQTLSAVFEPPAITGRQDWSFKTLFGRTLGSSCPLTSESYVYVDISSNRTLEYYMTLDPEPSTTQVALSGGVKVKYATYDIPPLLQRHRVLNVAAKYNAAYFPRTHQAPLLTVHQFQTGYGLARGGLTCLLYNRHSEDLTVSYTQIMPWYLRTFLHSLHVSYQNDSGDVGVGVGVGGRVPFESAVELRPSNLHYVPGRDRSRAYMMELMLRLPANAVTQVSVEFERALLKWTEYPPDASHGFYVSSAIISTILPADELSMARSSSKISSALTAGSSETRFLRLHTESLLVSLPTPDFSMPYNVICLACTVLAIAFGSIHNLTVRRFRPLDSNKQGIVSKLKMKLRNLFGKNVEKPDNEPKAEGEVKQAGNEEATLEQEDQETKKEK